MIEISRHIESLLLEHECVIVPDFGGFVTHHVPARFVEEEQLFLPPSRSVGFNAQLRMNDGVLVQSIMLAEDASFPEAVRIVAEMVATIKRELEEKGQYLFAGIGTLTYSLDGHYHFSPNEAGILTPQLYALDSFALPKLLLDVKPAASVVAAVEQQEGKAAPRRYTFSVRREWFNYGVAAAVAVVAYFAWATPVPERLTASNEKAAAFTQELFRPTPHELLSATPTSVAPAEAVVNTTPAAAPAAPSPSQAKETKQAVKAPVVEPQESYTLVLASAITAPNAAVYVEKLQEAGYKDARVWKHRKMVRVVYGNYATAAAAQQALRELREQPEFEQAWTMQLP